ncbi:hypothetical protein PAXRUDRAFT_833323 [Paxillus rubicundulus Ve08.2h10]|uniref:Uncharacterized protein n=1 Tax=Paxillus rubicundulus Ve08.2h10 TaxID=930991 RepID=A0A0D0CYU3_9AGAM|nr:hypothetical protein PAXRUDRAFT_833323 [Paxillus rubicundulus Ve08.2h10]
MVAREDSHRWTRLRREQNGWQQTRRRPDERCGREARKIDSHLFRASASPLESEQGPCGLIVNWRATC